MESALSIVLPDEIELRLLQERHAEELFRLTDRNRVYLRQWLPWLDRSKCITDVRTHIVTWLEIYEERNGLTAGIYWKGGLAGTIGIHRIDWINRNTSIGYWLDAECQGFGVMTRSCEAIVSHAFREYGLHRVEIRCALGNDKSCAIPERLGFKREGVVRGAQRLYDRFVDLTIYGMLACDWQQR